MGGRGIMAPRRLAMSGLIAVAPILRRAMIGLCCAIVAAIAFATLGASSASADPAASENIPLPVPAPLPKTGSAAPPAPAAAKAASEKPASDKAANDKPATETRQTPSLFPFSALFGNKSSTPAPEPPSPFDAKQRALLDRISHYLSNVQTMVGKFVQVGPDGG